MAGMALIAATLILAFTLGAADGMKNSNSAVTEEEETVLVNVDHKVPTVDPADFVVESSVIDLDSEYRFRGKYEAYATYYNTDGTTTKLDISDHVSIKYCGDPEVETLRCDRVVTPDELMDTSQVGTKVYRFTLNFNGVQIAKDFTFYIRLNTEELESANYINGFMNVSENDYYRIKRLYLLEPSTNVRYYTSLNIDEFNFTSMDVDDNYELYVQLTDGREFKIKDEFHYSSGRMELGTFNFAIG